MLTIINSILTTYGPFHIQKVEAGEPHDGQRTRTAAPEERA